MMKEVVNIQTHMRPIIAEVYGRFLSESADVETREYSDPTEEVMAALIHRSYISQKDVEICLAYDLAKHAAHVNFADIKALHQSLRASYAEPVT